jgi:hypothetical protein
VRFAQEIDNLSKLEERFPAGPDAGKLTPQSLALNRPGRQAQVGRQLFGGEPAVDQPKPRIGR